MADISQIKLPSGDIFDLIDEKSGYITAQYIENKTDYVIPVSRVGEIVVGETPIGTDSTNFPTSKAVVDYVDERIVQEMTAIDVGVESVNGKTGKVTISASDVGAVPTSRTVNGKALSSNITLDADDVQALRISTSSTDALESASIWSNTNDRIAIGVTTARGNGNGAYVNYRAYFKDDSIGLYNNTTSSWVFRIYEPKDYVVAESTGSTVGTWYYRCWASGATEAWGRFEETTGCTTSDASGYRSTGITPTNFPNATIDGVSKAIFSQIPVVTASATGVGANICWPVQQSNVTATAVGKWALFRNSPNGSAKGYIAFNVKGRWK